MRNCLLSTRNVLILNAVWISNISSLINQKKLSLDEDNVQEFVMFKITNLAIFNFSYLGLYWKHGRKHRCVT